VPAGEDDLLTQIHALDAKLRAEMTERWRRDLPFEELVFDRWERARGLGFGEDASIYRSAYVFGDVSVGEGTWIGPLVMLDGTGGIEIGHHCSISAGVHLYSHDTVRWALSGGKHESEIAPVRIGDCTYVGSHSTVLMGTEVGHHCVIGANSLVNRDIPPHSVAYGVPAEVRGEVEIKESGEIEISLAQNQSERRDSTT
jgi:acetyltransferase-like isoleucine patch superfamily enzyme